MCRCRPGNIDRSAFLQPRKRRVTCSEISGHIAIVKIISYNIIVCSLALKQAMSEIGNTKRIIQTFRKVQFISQFLILSKFSEDSDYVTQFFTIIEAIKFYFKSIALVESHGIYIQTPGKPEKSLSPIEMLKTKKSIKGSALQEQNIVKLPQREADQSVDAHSHMGTASAEREQLPNEGRSKRSGSLTFMNFVGEVLTILRPLVSILFIRVYGINSYKSYFASFVIDFAIVFIFQRGMKISSTAEREEIAGRRKEMIKRYIFRKPFFSFLLQSFLNPLLTKILKPERILSKIIMSLLNMQSSISLTL